MQAGMLQYVWYPLFVGGAIAAFALMIGAGTAILVAAYLPIVVVGIVIVALEYWFPERLDWRPRWADVKADALFMAVVQIALPRLLAFIVILAASSWMHSHAQSGWWPHAWPLALQAVAMVLAVDLMRYWLHRACHRYDILWRLHEVHHSPDILYVVNVGRFHPIEKTLHFSLDTLPFVLLGVAPEVIACYFLLYSVNGLFQHSNVRLRYGWLNYVVGSAETHRWHHARDPRTASCNFGNTTIVWDLLFGTWCLPGAVGDIGIMDRTYPKDFWSQMWTPFHARGRRRTLKGSVAHLLVAMRLRATRLVQGLRIARSIRDPMRMQRALLARIVRENRDTTFGREHGFARISGYDDYARQVPVAEFEALRPYVEAEIERGERALTAEAPVRYVRTSGTTGKPKDIPLTAAHLGTLRRIHRTAVSFQHSLCPAGFEGSILAIVSPADEGVLANGKPFGSASGVVAGNTPRAVLEKFVVPPAVLTIHDSETKYLLILRLALARRDVTYFGTANPTTPLALIKLYREHEAELIEDLRRGTFFRDSRVPEPVRDAVRSKLRPAPERAAELERVRSAGRVPCLRDLWPELRLVVAWTCASAGIAVEALRRELAPRTRILELGYISSEFRGTITIGRRAGSGLPTFNTHFLEFVERDKWDSGEPEFLTLDRIRKGVDYYIIVTTPSGLYRYFINDLVRVTGRLHSTPLLKFLQKGKGVTNITGEKLYESQVLAAVREAMAEMGRDPQFVMMLADEEGQRYRLYVESAAATGPDAEHLAAAVDGRLRALNVEYDAKRESGRLGAPVARWLVSGSGDAYKRFCVQRGQREGQFKMTALAYQKDFAFDLDACSAAPG
jgi:sterol desaturase/sphingolipid hydroxylase (fatty acid hydroxylase superfamily)